MSEEPFSLAKAILEREPERLIGVTEGQLHDGTSYVRYSFKNREESPANELATKARLEIRDGRIHYRLYQQDGTMQPMDCPDTPSNRLCVSWFQAHDRYTTGGDGADEEGRGAEGGV